ncbi:MAG: hypothetical protein WCK31_03835 [bacterium]
MLNPLQVEASRMENRVRRLKVAITLMFVVASTSACESANILPTQTAERIRPSASATATIKPESPIATVTPTVEIDQKTLEMRETYTALESWVTKSVQSMALTYAKSKGLELSDKQVWFEVGIKFPDGRMGGRAFTNAFQSGEYLGYHFSYTGNGKDALPTGIQSYVGGDGNNLIFTKAFVDSTKKYRNKLFGDNVITSTPAPNGNNGKIVIEVDRSQQEGTPTVPSNQGNESPSVKVIGTASVDGSIDYNQAEISKYEVIKENIPGNFFVSELYKRKILKVQLSSRAQSMVTSARIQQEIDSLKGSVSIWNKEIDSSFNFVKGVEVTGILKSINFGYPGDVSLVIDGPAYLKYLQETYGVKALSATWKYAR